LEAGLAVYVALLIVLTGAVVSNEDLMHLMNISRSVKYVGSVMSNILSIVIRVKFIMNLCSKGMGKR
jgi:ABC-type polysaccharide/polyol phosphate export permease